MLILKLINIFNFFLFLTLIKKRKLKYIRPIMWNEFFFFNCKVSKCQVDNYQAHKLTNRKTDQPMVDAAIDLTEN